MFSLPMRIVISMASLALAAYSFSRDDIFVGGLMLLVPAAGVWGYFRYGAIWLAFQAYCRGDIARVRQLLARTNVGMLSRESRAYYDWLQGIVLIDEERFDEARVHLLSALAGPLRTDGARATVLCLLAQLAIETGDGRSAAAHLREARALCPRPDILSAVTRLEEKCRGAMS